MASIFGEGKIFAKSCKEYIPIFGKNSKIQNGRHFWGGENFLKIRYPVGRKFRQNRSISHGLGDMSTFAFFSIQNS